MSRYSKKHYEDIAKIIYEMADGGDYLNKNILVSKLAFMFSQDNPNFDRERFLEATR